MQTLVARAAVILLDEGMNHAAGTNLHEHGRRKSDEHALGYRPMAQIDPYAKM
jgi:hypothetical protein